jgi:hypothetical protein
MTATWANSSISYDTVKMVVNANSYAFSTGSSLYDFRTAEGNNGTSLTVGINKRWTTHYVYNRNNTSTEFAESYYEGPMPSQILEVGTQKGFYNEGAYHYIYGSGPYPLRFFTDSTQRMIITANGVTLFGNTSTAKTGAWTVDPKDDYAYRMREGVQIHTEDKTNLGAFALGLYSWSRGAGAGCDLDLCRSYANTVGEYVVTPDGTKLCAITAAGVANNTFSPAATIVMSVQGTPNTSTGSVPGRIFFNVTPPNAAWPEGRVSIDKRVGDVWDVAYPSIETGYGHSITLYGDKYIYGYYGNRDAANTYVWATLATALANNNRPVNLISSWSGPNILNGNSYEVWFGDSWGNGNEGKSSPSYFGFRTCANNAYYGTVTAFDIYGIDRTFEAYGPGYAKIPAYFCRAWVNFDGTGTVTIRDSGNISSVTDIDVGHYQPNFATAMPHANYAVFASCDTSSGQASMHTAEIGDGYSARSTSSFRVMTQFGSEAFSRTTSDQDYVSACVFL